MPRGWPCGIPPERSVSTLASPRSDFAPALGRTRLPTRTRGIADFPNSTSTGSGSDVNAEVPVRIADTRTGSGLPYSGHTLIATSTLTIQVAGAGGVPSMTSSAPPTAVVINVTVTNTTATSYLSVWPSNVTRPLISDINWVSGQTQPELVVVPVSPSGQVSFYNHAGSVDLVVDVGGWYS